MTLHIKILWDNKFFYLDYKLYLSKENIKLYKYIFLYFEIYIFDRLNMISIIIKKNYCNNGLLFCCPNIIVLEMSAMILFEAV